MREEDATNAEVVPSSAAGILVSIASATDADESLMGVQDHDSGDWTPDREVDGGSNDRDESGSP
jgi:hypothetical protein